MSSPWPKVLLREVLTERLEIPPEDAVANGEIPIIAKIMFNNGGIQLRGDGQTKTGMILIKPGDLVVSGINAAKGAIAIYEEENTKPIAATIHYSAYVPNKDRVNTSYLWRFLRSRVFRDLLAEHMPGGIKTELNAKRLLSIPIPLPSPEEQQRIVARIEELAAKIEEARWLRLAAVEEVEVLFVSLITQRLQDLPINGSLSEVLLGKPRNGWSARCDNQETGVPVLTLAAVTGFHYRETEFKRTSEPTFESAHYWLHPGDLLITRSNTPNLVGHAAIYNGSPSPCIYPDLMMRLEVNEQIAYNRFVHYWLRSVPVREYIRRMAKGTSPTMKKISQETVMNIPFPSSLSLQYQHQLVEYIDDLDRSVNKLKQLQSETSAELDALLPSILDKAFKGEL